MHEHNLGEALALLHEGGIELISDERVLNWADLHAMGLTLEDASQLRSSLNLDATPPGGHATRRTSLQVWLAGVADVVVQEPGHLGASAKTWLGDRGVQRHDGRGPPKQSIGQES